MPYLRGLMNEAEKKTEDIYESYSKWLLASDETDAMARYQERIRVACKLSNQQKPKATKRLEQAPQKQKSAPAEFIYDR
jgi:hypothetical protein